MKSQSIITFEVRANTQELEMLLQKAEKLANELKDILSEISAFQLKIEIEPKKGERTEEVVE